MSEILRSYQPARHRIYDFSLPPWHLATTLWPTLGGNYLPRNSRLFAVIPAEGRMWIPSLYFGCLPCLLVLTALVRKKNRLSRTLLVAASLSLLAALGNYSPVWLLREFLNSLGMIGLADQLPPDPASGLYWLLCSTIPAYELFRYPAKWTVWLVAACCLLAARQLNDQPTALRPPISNYIQRLVKSISAIGLIACGGLWWLALNSTANSTGLNAWLATAAPDAWLGTPEASAVAWSLSIAFAVPLCVLWLNLSSGKWAMVTLVEMTLCASCWVSFLPPPALSVQTAIPINNSDPASSFVWADRSEADIQQDIPVTDGAHSAQTQADYQQIFALGKLASIANVRCLSATHSIEPAPLTALRSWLSTHDHLTANQPELDQVLAELGVTHRLVRQREPNQLAKFQWQAIANPQPFCQLLSGDKVHQQADVAISWQWIDSDILEVRIDTARLAKDQASKLLIRQLNDGGWNADNGTGEELAIPPLPLFLVVPLNTGETHVRLTRKWLW